ncbi:MAG: aminoglycoside phosphotransferase family protein [Bacilli bacterium]|nr:aminoglycoside phosphotransferase family protein [Bacilli bacterium]
MIILPDKYKVGIISMFGTKGEDWLANVPEIVDRYIKKFNLTNVELINDLTLNIVLLAECEEFGNIVLKMGLPDIELLVRETIALEIFNGKGACQCYYSNKEDGIMVLERLIPGETLHNVYNREERIRAFCDVASNLAVKLKGPIQLPAYREILDRSIKQSNEQSEKFKSLQEFIIIADELYKEIENSNLPKYLLHADLHHGNILTSSNGRKAIDPHGFLGEKVLETARFMENEIEKQGINKDNILEVVELMAKYYKEDKALICKALFIDYVLSTCWNIEINFEDEHINRDINNLKLILDCIENILTPKEEKGIALNLNKKSQV